MSLSSEVYMLAHRLDRLAQQHRGSRDLTFNSLRRALQQIIACFPVYRSYITSDALHPDDRRYVHQAVSQAQRRNPTMSHELLAFVRDMLLLQYHVSSGTQGRESPHRDGDLKRCRCSPFPHNARLHRLSTNPMDDHSVDQTAQERFALLLRQHLGGPYLRERTPHIEERRPDLR